MSEQFNVDDTVRTVKGGPVMAVKAHGEDGRVLCRWYEPHVGWQEKAFQGRTLRLVRRAKGWRALE